MLRWVCEVEINLNVKITFDFILTVFWDRNMFSQCKTLFPGCYYSIRCIQNAAHYVPFFGG